MRTTLLAAVLAASVMLTGCEGAFTGSEVARVALQAGADGGYAPVKFNLTPEMNPVAFNFRADFSQNPAEFGKWNSYRAALSKDGAVIVSRSININHPVSRPDDSPPPPTQTIHTLFIVDLPGAGEYELTITPVKPAALTLGNPQADVRRNVQRPPQ